MKKFLIFLVAIVTVVCIGLTTYYFMRNDELINFTTKEIFCNTDNMITLKDLGYTVSRKNKRTKYTYTTDNEEAIKYDSEKGGFVANQGGDYTIIISTTNKNYSEFKVTVHIGDGEVNPYYMFKQSDLEWMGSQYDLSKNFALMSDITLSEDFLPIGHKADDTYEAFTGTFNGNGYTIRGLNLTAENTTLTNAGLFSSIEGGKVTDLVISNAKIAGDYATAGALAGTASGTFNKIRVEGDETSISSIREGARVGAMFGALNNSVLDRSYVENASVTANGTIGGLVGEASVSDISAVYANNVTLNTENGVAGGLLGRFVISTDNGVAVRQSYAVANSENANAKAFIGEIATTGNFNIENDKVSVDGVSKSKLNYLIGNYAYIGENNRDLVGYASNVSKFFTSNNGLLSENQGFYLVSGFRTPVEFEYSAGKKYPYYGYSNKEADIVGWDGLVWYFVPEQYPQLSLTDSTVAYADARYLLSNLSQMPVTDVTDLKAKLSSDIVDKYYVLEENGVYDFEGAEITPHVLKNSVIDGKGATIKNVTLSFSNRNMGLFSAIVSSTVSNLKFENVKFKNVESRVDYAGVLAGTISSSNDVSSTIENITITSMPEIDTTVSNLGLIAGSIHNTTITGCVVGEANAPVVVKTGANIANVAGLVAVLDNSSSQLLNNKVYATLSGVNRIGGLVVTNRGSVDGNMGNINIQYNSGVSGYVAGVVTYNQESGTLSNTSVSVNIRVLQANDNFAVAGMVCENYGKISNVTVDGEGITNAASIKATYGSLSGVAAKNFGTIENVYNKMARVGSYVKDKQFQVAGLVNTNTGSLTQGVVTSNLEGNTVAGAVVNMENGSMDQLFIGTITTSVVGDENPVTFASIGRNSLKGDKYVAGVVYIQTKGKISNVQASSRLEALESGTAQVSLIALIFPDGAEMDKVTINSEFAGVAANFYRETWVDYDPVSVGDSWIGKKVARQFNLFAEDAASGTMRNVVINTEALGGASYKKSTVFTTTWSGDVMKDTADARKSFIKEVNNSAFSNQSSYTGTVSYKGNGYAWDWNGADYNFNLEFSIGNSVEDTNHTWVGGDGITLRFVKEYMNSLTA